MLAILGGKRMLSYSPEHHWTLYAHILFHDVDGHDITGIRRNVNAHALARVLQLGNRTSIAQNKCKPVPASVYTMQIGGRICLKGWPWTDLGRWRSETEKGRGPARNRTWVSRNQIIRILSDNRYTTDPLCRGVYAQLDSKGGESNLIESSSTASVA